MSPALNGSSTLERFERSDASEIRNRIMFDFYPGLPHVYHLIIAKSHTHLNVKNIIAVGIVTHAVHS